MKGNKLGKTEVWIQLLSAQTDAYEHPLQQSCLVASTHHKYLDRVFAEIKRTLAKFTQALSPPSRLKASTDLDGEYTQTINRFQTACNRVSKI